MKKINGIRKVAGLKNAIKLASVAALIFVAPQAHAGEFFVGATAGTSSFSGLNEACDDFIDDNRFIGGSPVTCRVNEDSDTVVGINAGYNFTRIIGVELGYIDLGEYSASVGATRIAFPVTAEVDIAYAGLVLTAPLTEAFSLSARLGGVNANAEVSSFGASLELEDETTGFVGVSADFRVTESISLQVRYDDLDVIDLTSAGIRFHF